MDEKAEVFLGVSLETLWSLILARIEAREKECPIPPPDEEEIWAREILGRRIRDFDHHKLGARIKRR